MSDDPQSVELNRALGPIDAICVVIGAIVGVGIFFTPQRVAAIAGSGGMAMLAWAAGGAVALLGALTFMELGGMYRRAGGQYEILRDAYGPAVAFLFVFCNATAVQAGAIAVIAIVCVDNLAVGLRGEVLASGTSMAISLGLIVLLVAANARGVRAGAIIQNATVAAKLATLLLIAALAAFVGGTAAPQAAAAAPQAGFALSALFAAMVPTLFSFGGWQHALWIGGEVRDPERNVPRAILIGVTIVVLVYLLANWAYLDLLGYRGVVEHPVLAAEAVGVVWPQYGRRGIALAVAFSAFGVLNAQLLSGPRLLFAMARDGRFFRRFGEVNPRTRTPVAAIVLLGALAMILLLVAGNDGSNRLLNGVVFVDGVFFVLTGAAVFLLRRLRPDAPRPVRVPLYPLVPALFVVGELGVLIGAHVDPQVRGAAFLGAIWIGVALMLYLLRFRARRS